MHFMYLSAHLSDDRSVLSRDAQGQRLDMLHARLDSASLPSAALAAPAPTFGRCPKFGTCGPSQGSHIGKVSVPVSPPVIGLLGAVALAFLLASAPPSVCREGRWPWGRPNFAEW